MYVEKNIMTVEIFGSNVKFLGFTMCLLLMFYCVFISLLICGNFVPVPRVLSETMPFSYTAVIFRYTEVLLNVANFTMVAMLLGITVIILKNKIMYYMFLGFLFVIVVLEIICLFFLVYRPMQYLRSDLLIYMIREINSDVKLMERLGLDNVDILQTLLSRPMGKLQTELICCGVESYRDWEIRIQDTFRNRIQNETIPISCCWYPYPEVKYFCRPDEVYSVSCLSKILFYLNRYTQKCLRLFVTLLAMQVLIFLFYVLKIADW